MPGQARCYTNSRDTTTSPGTARVLGRLRRLTGDGRRGGPCIVGAEEGRTPQRVARQFEAMGGVDEAIEDGSVSVGSPSASCQ